MSSRLILMLLDNKDLAQFLLSLVSVYNCPRAFAHPTKST